ncbi:histidinol-phosphate transaminase [Alteromonadaceae bacterium BrNp21-10]|nr:histidinol-phosphate transaminase [Alteromonadaceae bacterium BrNp21-10]
MSADLIAKLLSPHLKSLQPYESARRLFKGGKASEQAWMNANESPFTNDYSLDCDTLNRYPDCQPPAVISAYAAYSGVTPEQTLVSRGADEGIELLIRAFCEAGQDSVLICPPTYGMYAISAKTFNVGVEQAPLKADFSLDIDAISQYVGKVNVVFICSPNNPTGTDVGKAQLQQVLELFADSALVVVDEAYIEFTQQQSWAAELASYPNLVILRTLSKAFALAGIRCGFTLAAPEIIQELLKVIAPYPLAEPVIQIAVQALSDEGVKRTQSQVTLLNQQKHWLQQQLGEMPAITLVGDTAANFVLMRLDDKQALMDYLVANGILIRDQSKQLNLANCLRISIGSEQQNLRLLNAIQQFYAQKG